MHIYDFNKEPDKEPEEPINEDHENLVVKLKANYDPFAFVNQLAEGAYAGGEFNDACIRIREGKRLKPI